LCDGEDEPSEELKKALDELKSPDSQEHSKCLEIRGKVENVVLSLHRVEAMKKSFPEIFSVINETDID